jgi:hypothetical protein
VPVLPCPSLLVLIDIPCEQLHYLPTLEILLEILLETSCYCKDVVFTWARPTASSLLWVSTITIIGKFQPLSQVVAHSAIDGVFMLLLLHRSSGSCFGTLLRSSGNHLHLESCLFLATHLPCPVCYEAADDAISPLIVHSYPPLPSQKHNYPLFNITFYPLPTFPSTVAPLYQPPTPPTQAPYTEQPHYSY